MKNIHEILDIRHFNSYLEESKEYGYQSLVLCVIDSVFSISAKYESTLKVVERFSNHAQIDMYKDEFKTSDFIDKYGSMNPDYLAQNIFNNRQRTSTLNGILKAEATTHFIKVLQHCGIETKEDLLKFKDVEMLKNEIRKIKGQKSGIALEYLFMLAGDTDRYKPDRHIFNFFENYLGYGKLTEESLKVAFVEQYNLVNKEYPRFSIRMFDNLIWRFVKSKEDYQNGHLILNHPFFMKEQSWYYFDKDTYKFYLTSKAPQEAIDSYERFYSYSKN